MQLSAVPLARVCPGGHATEGSKIHLFAQEWIPLPENLSHHQFLYLCRPQKMQQ